MKRLVLPLMLAASPQMGLAQDSRLDGGTPVPTAICDDRQRFFLRNDIVQAQIGAELQFCKTFSSDRPATFSYTRDGLSDSWQVSSDAALGFVLKRPSDESTLSGVLPNLAYSTLVAFAEFDGSRFSSGNATGTARFGLSQELLFQSGRDALSYSVIDIVPYYQAGFDGDASGYGLELSYVPVIGPANHNAVVDNGIDPLLFSTTSVFRIDAYHSDEAGSSSLGSDQNYLWIGADLGANLQFRNKGRTVLNASLDLSYYYDTESSQDALLGSANLSFPLNEAGNASLNMTYTRGKSRQTLEDVDAFQLAFGLKF